MLYPCWDQPEKSLRPNVWIDFVSSPGSLGFLQTSLAVLLLGGGINPSTSANCLLRCPSLELLTSIVSTNSLVEPLGSLTEPEALVVGLPWTAAGRMAGQSVRLGKLESVLTVWLFSSSQLTAPDVPTSQIEWLTSRTSPQSQLYFSSGKRKVSTDFFIGVSSERGVLRVSQRLTSKLFECCPVTVPQQFPHYHFTSKNIFRVVLYITYYCITHSQMI